MSLHVGAGVSSLTRVDQLLLGDFPALVAVDLGLEFANLAHELEHCKAGGTVLLLCIPFPMARPR